METHSSYQGDLEYNAKFMANLPRGLTCRGVNKLIANHLLLNAKLAGQSLFDIPCGNAEFLTIIQAVLPDWKISGADLLAKPAKPPCPIYAIDASKEFNLDTNRKFDYITSISGIVEFDNTSGFIKECVKYLKDDGTLIITNDNHLTIVDRFLFLLFGRKKMFPLLLGEYQAAYKEISLQELQKIINENDYEIKDVKYCHFVPGSLLLLPMALIIYLLQTINLLLLTRVSKNGSYRVFTSDSKKNHHDPKSIPLKTRLKLFPLASLFYRHYVVFAKRRA